MTMEVFPSLELGFHNKDMEASINRLKKAGSFEDQSTIIICPTRGTIPAKVVAYWQGMIRPMNQKVIGPIFAIQYEVATAYNQMIEGILSNPDLASYKYILSIEEDNCPPADGLLRLYEAIEGKIDGHSYDCVGGLYWTKGEEGQPMIYGDPKVMPRNFIPQLPNMEIKPANGLGMGFNLWRLDMFKDKKLRTPWFKTQQEIIPGKGVKVYTQDLYFYEDALAYGYKFACDTRVKVGHYDYVNDMMW